jgi:death-on-curing protein
MEFIYLDKSDIIELHDDIIREFGGSLGVLNEGAIAYAAEAPGMNVFGHERYPTIVDKAAILCYTLVTRHAFVDGNKRIGYEAMNVFLSINGYELKGAVDSKEDMVLEVAKGDMSLDDIKAWIELSLVKSASSETIDESLEIQLAPIFPLLSLLSKVC